MSIHCGYLQSWSSYANWRSYTRYGASCHAGDNYSVRVSSRCRRKNLLAWSYLGLSTTGGSYAIKYHGEGPTHYYPLRLRRRYANYMRSLSKTHGLRWATYRETLQKS